MYAGRVVELGPTEQVFRFPVHPYTRGLLAAVPVTRARRGADGIEGQPPRPGRRPKGCSFAPRCSYAVEQLQRRDARHPVAIGDRFVRCLRAREIESESHAAAERGARRRSPGPATRSSRCEV